MVQKKIEIKICFIYQDIHIYLKYFNLICKIIKFIKLEPTIKKRAYMIYVLRVFLFFQMMQNLLMMHSGFWGQVCAYLSQREQEIYFCVLSRRGGEFSIFRNSN